MIELKNIISWGLSKLTAVELVNYFLKEIIKYNSDIYSRDNLSKLKLKNYNFIDKSTFVLLDGIKNERAAAAKAAPAATGAPASPTADADAKKPPPGGWNSSA